MDTWLKNAITIVNKSLDKIETISYENLVYVFYDHLSNRNLALLISKLYNKDVDEIYFEIDKIISQKRYDTNIVSNIILELEKNGFQEWIDEDD